jgi:hypothetical protein
MRPSRWLELSAVAVLVVTFVLVLTRGDLARWVP